jgi:hypothetical protein
VYTFIAARALKLIMGPKAPRKHRLLSAWTQRFQRLGPDFPKAEFERLWTDRDDFIKRETFRISPGLMFR